MPVKTVENPEILVFSIRLRNLGPNSPAFALAFAMPDSLSLPPFLPGFPDPQKHS